MVTRTPQVRLLHTDQCAPENTVAARRVLLEALEEVGLTGDVVEEVLIKDEEESRAHNFVGGPAIHVDGQDVDASVRDLKTGGLGCRAYFTSEGYSPAPPKEMVVQALREAMEE
ncbi:MAG: hypothetical protein Kow00129_06570 [Thermoleophilia bacterium]